MRFVLEGLELEFDDREGFKHPKSGQWVPTAKECLKGWVEADPQKRMLWVQMIQYIEKVMTAVDDPGKVANTDEIVEFIKENVKKN